MKQYITPEQLNQLSDRGKERLVKWIESKLEPPIPGSAYIGPTSSDHQICYFMTIGQMIEFLDENTDNFELRSGRMGKSYLIDVPDGSVIWHGWAGDTEIEDEFVLCDALWEACKEVLNEEK